MKELDQLKDLLVGPELRDLAELQARLEDPARRTRDLADVLPEAIRAGTLEGDRLASALQEPVGSCIRYSIERDSQTYADVLFPVMGPAIRRAIGVTLKTFVQSINQAVEHSLSIRGLRWRWEAWRSGAPFAAVVLKHTLIYRVEAAYLIDSHSGLLIGYAVASTHSTLKDEDAVSAMLTAIQDFVQDSFSSTGDAGLETVEIGERALWVIREGEVFLACMISGIAPPELRARLEAVLSEIRSVYGHRLVHFDGDKSAVVGVEAMLEQCLAMEYKDAEASARTPALWPWVTSLVLILGALGYAWWLKADERHRLAALDLRLRAEPGLVVLNWRDQGDERIVELLRDPLAPEPQTLVTDPDLRGRIAFEVTPVHSLEPAFVLARAQAQLRPPPGVELTLDGERLVARGAAPPQWIERTGAVMVLPAGVVELDLTGVAEDLSALWAAIRDALRPPPGVELSLEGKSVLIEGIAPWGWIREIPAHLGRVDLLRSCDLTGLAVAEWVEARALATELEASQVFFALEANPAPASEALFDRASQILDRLGELDLLMRLRLHVRVIGFSDGVGSERWNQWLRQQRAGFVRDTLIARGGIPELLIADVDKSFRRSSVPAPALRRVGFSVDLTAPELPSCLP